MSSENRSASRPAICLTASRWYGSTTLSSSATSQDGPIRYPRRAPAIDQVFENVRVTTSGHVLADEVERRPVARTGRTPRRPRPGPGARSSSWRTRSTGSTSPVGLFGDVRNTTCGRCSVSTRSTSAGSSVKSASPLPLDHRRAGHPGDLGVHLVRRLERCDGAAGPGIGQQHGLQHLVGSVGGEDHATGRPRAWPRSPRAARWRPDRDIGASRRATPRQRPRRGRLPGAVRATRWCSDGPARRPARSDIPRARAGRHGRESPGEV